MEWILSPHSCLKTNFSICHHAGVLLRQNNPRFCGLTPISTYKENNLYKYYYGESTDKDEIEKMLKDVQEKIPDAFVVSAIKSNGSAKK